MRKILFVLLIIAVLLTGCGTYKTLYGITDYTQDEVNIIELKASNEINIILVCSDNVVCYEISHSYGVGLSCFKFDELKEKSYKYIEKCKE